MKNHASLTLAALLFVSGIGFAQTTPSNPTPGTPPTTQPTTDPSTGSPSTTTPSDPDRKLNSTPNSVPGSGVPSQDTLIRGNSHKSGMKNGDMMKDGSRKGKMGKGKKNDSESTDPNSTGNKRP